jgi:hypothetical protein
MQQATRNSIERALGAGLVASEPVDRAVPSDPNINHDDNHESLQHQIHPKANSDTNLTNDR